MNIQLLAADLAGRVPEMSRDSLENNEGLIRRIIERELGQPQMLKICAWCKCEMPPVPCSPEMAGQISHGICEFCFIRECETESGAENLIAKDREFQKSVFLKFCEVIWPYALVGLVVLILLARWLRSFWH